MCLCARLVKGPSGASCHHAHSDILAAHVISEAPHLPSFLLLPLPSGGGNFPILPGSATRMRFLAITAA